MIILNKSDLRWNHDINSEVLAKLEYSVIDDDGGITFHFRKEKKMKYDLKNVTSISIEISDDGTVTATAYGRDPYCPGHVFVIKRASAKCSPNDIYDFNIGAKLAMDRLYEGYDMTPKQKRKPYNGKIFVQRFPGSVLLPNHIYNVKNGVIISVPRRLGKKDLISNRYEPFIFADMTDAEMSCAVYKNIYSAYDSDVTAACCSGCYFVKGDQ